MTEEKTYCVSLKCNNCGQIWFPSIQKCQLWHDWLDIHGCPHCGCSDACLHASGSVEEAAGSDEGTKKEEK